jgi:hypothetical protein
VPQTTPNVFREEPIWPSGATAPLFPNPMYDSLITNIPKQLMQYSDQAFPSRSLLFPTREDVQKYLIGYSEDVRHLIAFSIQVEDISLSQEDGQDRWDLTARSTIDNKVTKNVYDAIVIANGHYSVPFIPSVPGIQAFQAKYTSTISHAKNYRSPRSFKSKKVIVVGGGASGLDIGSQIGVVCTKPLINSVRSEEPLKLGREGREEVPPIVEYLVEERGVRFEDGRVEKDIDAIVYCTGYLYSYPFLRSLDPPIVTTGRRVIGLYKQLFHISHPTLAFTALPQKVIPFPLSESQAAVIAKVWSNELTLPSEVEMRSWEKARVEERGDTTNFHILGFPKDADYLNELHDCRCWQIDLFTMSNWFIYSSKAVSSAEKMFIEQLLIPRYLGARSAKEGFKKEPPYWDEQQRYTRSVFVEIRKRFVELGGTAKSMKELGPEFEDLDR